MGTGPTMPGDPDLLPRTGPAGPAPSMPLDELDIRIADDTSSGEFVRRLWWRATVPLPDDPAVHTLVAAYVTDVYMIDPALQVHGHSMKARTHRSGTTDSSIWFHRPVRADEWNLLECRSPAAARGRGVVTASLVRTDGAIAATMTQEGLIARTLGGRYPYAKPTCSLCLRRFSAEAATAAPTRVVSAAHR